MSCNIMSYMDCSYAIIYSTHSKNVLYIKFLAKAFFTEIQEKTFSNTWKYFPPHSVIKNVTQNLTPAIAVQPGYPTLAFA